MELTVSQGKTYKIKYQFVIYTCIISFLFSLVRVDTTSLLFTLPFFYLCFVCGYQALLSYSVGMIISILFFQLPIEIFYISMISFFILEFCQLFQSMKASYIPYLLTLIAGIYYAYCQMNLLTTLLLTILTYTNIIIFSYLPPLFIHSQSQLLTHERMKALSVVILICIMSLLPYSREMTMILIRIFILTMIYHQCLDDLLPSLFYISMLMLLIDTGYKDDILSLLIPLFFFYMFQLKSKWAIASLYLLSHVTLPFFVDFSYTYNGLIIVTSAFTFLLMPSIRQKIILSSSYEEITIKQQITKQVESFCHLFEQMTSLFNQTPAHNHTLEYIGYVYEEMCHDCASCESCFNYQYGPNRLVKLMNKGLKDKYNEEDLSFIHNYCLKPEQYIETLSSFQKDYYKVNRIQQEYQTMKKDLYHQFSLLNDVFNQFSQQIQIGHIEEKHIYEHLLGYHFQIAHLKKYYESQSTYYIEIGIYETTREEIKNELIPILETYLNESLDIHVLKTPMHQLGYTYLVLKHCTKYYIQYGISQCSKEPVACGDSYTLFTINENQYFALSDGMGQGQKASDDSTLTLDVIKQLMMNGISLNDTIQSVNALLRIKNRNDMFTTLDMVEVNMVLGTATFMKYGSCPTYIIRNHQVIEIESKSLPIGIISPLEISIEKEKLVYNDIVIMISDGFTQRFKEFLEENEYLIGEEHPKDIAQLLMHLSSDEEKNDDMTIIVLKLCQQ